MMQSFLNLYFLTVFLSISGFSSEPLQGNSPKDQVIIPGKVIFNPNETVVLNSRYAGVVNQVFVQDGEEVTAGARLATIERNQGFSLFEINSPITGTIIHRAISLGESISPTKEAFLITNLKKLWVVFQIRVQDLPFVKQLQPVLISTRVSAATTTETILFVSPSMNEGTRTISAFSTLNNDQKIWSPSQIVEGSFIKVVSPQEKRVPHE